MFNKIIHRFLSVTFDMALLLPVRNHGGGSIRMLKTLSAKMSVSGLRMVVYYIAELK